MTPAEFAAWELDQPVKHEYVDGVIQPLFGDRSARGSAGGTAVHSQLALEIVTLVLPPARPCRTYGSDVLIEMRRRSRYADVVVTCDERDRGATTVIRHPKLVIEVLSASTAKDDLGAKMREYHEIVELEEYVTVDSRKRWAHVSRRTSAGAWTFEAPLVAGRLEVRSVGATIDLERLYELCGVAEADEPSR